MSDALKECPFCAGSAEMREWDWPYVRYQARCAICRATPSGRKAARGDAIAAWNTRAPSPMVERDAGYPVEERAFHVVRTSDGSEEWGFAAQDRASLSSIPASDRADAYDLAETLNRIVRWHVERAVRLLKAKQPGEA